jgi:hypothetical protein
MSSPQSAATGNKADIQLYPAHSHPHASNQRFQQTSVKDQTAHLDNDPARKFSNCNGKASFVDASTVCVKL